MNELAKRIEFWKMHLTQDLVGSLNLFIRVRPKSHSKKDIRIAKCEIEDLIAKELKRILGL